MNMAFHFHSGLRYLVLLAGVCSILYSAFSIATKRPWDKRAFIVNAAYIGLLDLQILSGVFLVMTGLFYKQLIGHMAMMIISAGIAHGVSAKNKRNPIPCHKAALFGTAASLACIVGGIMAIQRSIL